MCVKIEKTCFVCHKEIAATDCQMNKTINLPVCHTCDGSDQEKNAEQEALDSLAEDFTCGCIS